MSRMVKRFVLFGAIFTLALGWGAAAHDVTDQSILVSGVWARATAMEAEMAMAEATPEAGMAMGHGGMDMGAVSAAYMTITNEAGHPVQLTEVSSPAAGMVEVHGTRVVDNVAQMNRIEGGITLADGESVELMPGGLHVMLMDLQMPLVMDQAIALTLTFAVLNDDNTPTDQTLEVVVGAPLMMTPPDASSFALINAWARPTVAAMAMGEATPQPGMAHGGMAMSDVSAVYMQLVNRGDTDDRLIAADTPVAGLVEIHESQMVDNVMQMNPVEGGLLIPAGERALLKPGGIHIMLMDLKEALVPGTAIPMTLLFESGAAVQVGIPVYDRMQAEMGM